MNCEAASEPPWAPGHRGAFPSPGSGSRQEELEEVLTCRELGATIFLFLRTKEASNNIYNTHHH